MSALGMYRSNVGRKTKTFNAGGYLLVDASSGRTTAEFYRAGEDDGSDAVPQSCPWVHFV